VQSLAVKQVILDFAQQVELALFRSNLSCQVRTLQGQVNQLVSRIKAKANGTHSAVDGPFHLSHASGELVASLSHEIRTPMTAIVGMTELMLAEVSSSYSAHQRDQLEVIANSANLLMATVDGIFNSQRIDGVIINYAPLNLRQCIESGFEMVAPEARSKGIELAYFTDALIPEDLIGDNTRLSQVIMNLVSNGIKYSHAGHVILQASQVPQPHGMKPLDIDGLSTVYIEISVTDTGNGIPVEFIQTLFSRTDSSRYGLPLCEALIKKMKGKIWLDKTASTGTVFRLIVPLLTSARQNVPSQPLPSPTGTEHRVMLVGTSPLVTRHIAELLQVKGFKYERADAHDRRRAGLFRALIFDLNSFLQAETADALNEWAGELADTPADTILLVENAADIEKHGVDPEQFSAIITKPVRHAALFGLLHIPDATGGIQHHRRSSPSRRASLTKHRQSATQHMSAPSILSTAQPSLVPAGDLLRKCRAIVVDDNGFNMKLITMQLEKIGLGFVKGVTSGQGALDELDVVQQDRNMAQYNIMVLDLNMPGMDGFETARRTLQRFPHSRPAIIACTANSGADAENVKKQCFQTGMDGFLSKPVKMADLQCEIVRVLSEQKPASPSSLKDR
jgi:signal transduction histidine kinase/CheY-like chemotaxis protein